MTLPSDTTNLSNRISYLGHETADRPLKGRKASDGSANYHISNMRTYKDLYPLDIFT